MGQAVVVEKTFVRAIYDKLMAEMKADDPAVLSGANTVSAAAPQCQHGVKSTAEVGGKN